MARKTVATVKDFAALASATSTGRAPTEAEKAETAQNIPMTAGEAQAAQDAGTLNPNSIAGRAIKINNLDQYMADKFNAAADGVESSLYAACSAFALKAFTGQILAAIVGQPADDAKDKAIFAGVMASRVASGKPVYRGTDDEVKAIAALPTDAERMAAAIKHVREGGFKKAEGDNKKGKGTRKLCSGLDDIRTYAFRLLSVLRSNHSAAVVACGSGETIEDCFERFLAFGESLYGTTFVGMTDYVDSVLYPEEHAKKLNAASKRETAKAKAEEAAKEAAAKLAKAEEIVAKQADRVAAALELVAAMGEDELEAFTFRFRAELEARGMVRPAETAAPLMIEGEALAA